MMLMSFHIPIRKGGVLPNQTQVRDSKCSNVFSYSQYQGESLTYPNSSARLQVQQTSFLIRISKGESYPTKLQCMTMNVSNVFSHAISKGEVLPTQSAVHDSKCYKRLFSFPLAREKYYLTELECENTNVANVFSNSHQKGRSLTLPNSSARV